MQKKAKTSSFNKVNKMREELLAMEESGTDDQVLCQLCTVSVVVQHEKRKEIQNFTSPRRKTALPIVFYVRFYVVSHVALLSLNWRVNVPKCNMLFISFSRDDCSKSICQTCAADSHHKLN